MGNELTGILAGTGAKMKGEVRDDHVAFRGAVKMDVPFEEIAAEARGTLLILSFRGHVVELGAGTRASQLASKVRSPPSRLDRLGVQFGNTAAVAGPMDPAFKGELATRADVVPGIPKAPVQLLFFAVEANGQLDALGTLFRLVAPGGCLWVIYPTAAVADNVVMGAAKKAGLAHAGAVRFSATHGAARLVRRE